MKNITTIFVLVVIFFAVSHSVSADSYINHTCNDGGLVTATINITPSGPFPSHYQSNFSALGQIQSTCGGMNMKLTAQNNNGTVYTLIPETFINPGIYPAIPATQSFQSPAGTAGTFAVHFELGVNEPEPVVDLCPDATNPLFPGIQTTLPEGGVIVNGKCKIKISGAITRMQCLSAGGQLVLSTNIGTMKYTFSFDRPIPEDLKVNIANIDSSFKNSFERYLFNDINRIFTLTGYSTNAVQRSVREGFIFLKKGETTHVTPHPYLTSDTNNVQDCTGSSARVPQEVYFKVHSSEPDIYIADFRSLLVDIINQ